jgi:hypothetical protein
MLWPSIFRSGYGRAALRAALVFTLSCGSSLALAQRAPVSPDRPWHGLGETRIKADARDLPEPTLDLDPEKTYSLPGLIDLAESRNPIPACGSGTAPWLCEAIQSRHTVQTHRLCGAHSDGRSLDGPGTEARAIVYSISTEVTKKGNYNAFD